MDGSNTAETMKKKQYQQPEPFTPTPAKDMAVRHELSEFLSETRDIISKNNPDLMVRGKKKQ